MITFVVSVLLLVLGYFIYGTFVTRVFGANPRRVTPCYRMRDDVDYLPMSTRKVFLIQFLNIAGTGPVFGAILGALYGPAVYLWIVLGCVFAGSVHDYLSGMISLRRGGANLPEWIGDELGRMSRPIFRTLTLFSMILVGAVFVITPSGLLASLCSGMPVLGDTLFWIIVVFLYYLVATVMPIDKIIGRIYPIFGMVLLFMAAALFICIFIKPGTMPEIDEAFSHQYTDYALPIFPGLCVTVACGAVSGFHATQSPMMARCLRNESRGRIVFYGSMIVEGLVALIWAAATIKFADSFDVTQYGLTGDETPYVKLKAVLTEGGTAAVDPAVLVKTMCSSWMGPIGTALAIVGVAALPITTGDTAFRCARLISADFMRFNQNKVGKRLVLAIPIFLMSALLMLLSFNVLWRYFSWVNQMMATVTLWALTVWMSKRSISERRHKWIPLICLVPALWMTMVCSSYILIAPEGLHLRHWMGYAGGGTLTFGVFVWYVIWAYRHSRARDLESREDY